mmetsp:Transcript_19090/g.21336  ORF Transcript_19090/g.21336 Transcript_19090/m.21336 type:complete len:81 (+) Transcript_19090:220-462(+)
MIGLEFMPQDHPLATSRPHNWNGLEMSLLIGPLRVGNKTDNSVIRIRILPSPPPPRRRRIPIPIPLRLLPTQIRIMIAST